MLVLSLLAACTSNGTAARFVEASSGAGKKAKSTAAGPPADWPHGVVTTSYDKKNPELNISDVETGRLWLRVYLPGPSKYVWWRESFSADWRWVTWVTGKRPITVHVAELRGTKYVETAKWELPGSRSSGTDMAMSLFAGSTNQLWAGWYTRNFSTNLFTVDASSRQAKLRRVKSNTLWLDSKGRRAHEVTVSVDGRPGWGGGLDRTEDELVHAIVQSVYTCDVQVSAKVLACWGRGPYGVLAAATGKGKGGRLSMRKLVPSGFGEVSRMVGSPDQKSILFYARNKGWYVVPVDGSAPPKKKFYSLDVNWIEPIDWI